MYDPALHSREIVLFKSYYVNQCFPQYQVVRSIPDGPQAPLPVSVVVFSRSRQEEIALLHETFNRVSAAVIKCLPDSRNKVLKLMPVYDEADGTHAEMRPDSNTVVTAHGLIKYCDAAQLALVQAHEIVHKALGHAPSLSIARSISCFPPTGSIDTSLIQLLHAVNDTPQDDNPYLRLRQLHPYLSRHHEREADQIGILATLRAGYDPRSACELWSKLAQVYQVDFERPVLPQHTHPSYAERTANALTIVAHQQQKGSYMLPMVRVS